MSVNNLSESLIRETSNEVNLSINSKFEPLKRILKSTGNWEFDGKLDVLDIQKLNNKFIPLLDEFEQISSMMIATTDGTEYMLVESDSLWTNRLTQPVGDTLISERFIWEYSTYRENRLIRSWAEESGYDPRNRPWFKGALEQAQPNSINWTSPYIFYTTGDPGITMSLYSLSGSGDTIITAYDILLNDINTLNQSIELTPNSFSLILSGHDLSIVGFPAIDRFMRQDSINKYVLSDILDLDIPVINRSFEEWINRDRIVSNPFEFKHERKTWWAGFEPVKAEDDEVILYALMLVPESDFLAEMNRTRIVIVFGFMLVLSLTLLVVRAYNQLHKVNLKLEEKNIQIKNQSRAIEKKNKEITDSINYASRIQTAILPGEEKISKLVDSHFVLFRPKDIVSGDYYWVEETVKYRLFAAVDCTGHGVPGAFVSMVGYGGLNSAVKEHKLSEPDDILLHLNGTITATFHQTIDSDVKDGMDIALCALDKESRRLHYSGAKNPVYLIRKTGSTLIVDKEEKEPVMANAMFALFEVKADRAGIEPRMDPVNFSRHVLETRKDDRVYIFSDGFADQFGGPGNKKFTYKRLKEKLLSVASHGMKDQEEELQKTFSAWKGSNDQVDDVLLIGFVI